MIREYFDFIPRSRKEYLELDKSDKLKLEVGSENWTVS